MEKSCKTFAPKAISKRLSDFGKETKTVIAQNNFFKKIRYFGRGLSKSFKVGFSPSKNLF